MTKNFKIEIHLEGLRTAYGEMEVQSTWINLKSNQKWKF